VTTVACAATDHVGNQSSDSFTVTVRGAKEQLTRLVDDVITSSRLPAGVKAQLLANLVPLLDRFDPADPVQRRAVCGAVRVFSTTVRLLSGRGVTPAQATAWTAAADRVRAVLDC
jgi:hypothetical protein